MSLPPICRFGWRWCQPCSHSQALLLSGCANVGSSPQSDSLKINPGDVWLYQSVPFRRAALIVGIMATVQFILQMSLLTKGIQYASASLIIDDTYYYLQTAWNAKMLGFVTFDGLHPTNGVQLLWFVLILLIAMLAKSKAVL